MKTHSARIALLLLLAALGALLGAGCRTFRGFGQDVQHVGGHIEHSTHH